MSHGQRVGRPHPFCTCPDLTWDMVTGSAPSPDLEACRARAFMGIDPHPVVGADELRTVVGAYLQGGGGTHG